MNPLSAAANSPSQRIPERPKPGPVPGPPTKKYTVLLPADLGEWGKRQPGGLSALMRHLLQAARQGAAGGPETAGSPERPGRADEGPG